MFKFTKNLLMFLIMIAIGVAGVMYMKKSKKPLEHTTTEMAARPVEVMTVEKKPFAATVVAYGNVEPASVLQGKSQVSGKVSFVHPKLKVGGSIPAGEVVVEIEPDDYQTSLAQSQADLAGSKSQLVQLDQEEQNLKQSLAVAQQNLKVAQANLGNVRKQDAPVRKNNEHIQQNLNLARQNLNLTRQNLALAKKELARVQQLGKKRLIPLSQVDAQQQQVLQMEQQVVSQQQGMVQMEQQLTQQDQSVARQDQSVLAQQQQILQQQQQVTELQGQLKTFASRRASAEAQVNRVQQQVKGQTTNLGRTKVIMPFDARISAVSVEKGSVVGVGGVLFEADNTAGVEVRAEVAIPHMRSLVTALQGKSLNFTAGSAVSLLHELNLSAKVRLAGADNLAAWEARVDRFSDTVDPVRRTLGVVVAVDNPYENVVLGQRPPLLKGMYVEVELSAPIRDEIVIPRKAVHQGRVYLVNAEQRLDIRPIAIQSQEGQIVVVGSGLEAGDTLVVNDLIPVIPGMPLLPTPKLPSVDSLGDQPEMTAAEPTVVEGAQ